MLLLLLLFPAFHRQVIDFFHLVYFANIYATIVHTYTVRVRANSMLYNLMLRAACVLASKARAPCTKSRCLSLYEAAAVHCRGCDAAVAIHLMGNVIYRF